MSENINRYEQAWEKLDNIFNLWSNISEEEEGELRSPANQKEINQSRKLLKEVKSMGCEEEDVVERIEELESVVDSIDKLVPKYKSRVVKAIIYSLLVIAGILLYFNQDTYKVPEFQYDKSWFVTEKGGYLFWNAFLDEKEQAQEDRKLYIKKGTQLTPIATIGNWVQVETQEGQRGIIDPLLLNGSKHVVSTNPETILYKKAGKDITDTIGEGISGVILDRYTNKDRSIWVRYFKIKFEDGKTSWARESDFNQPITKSIPEIEQLFAHVSNLEKVKANYIGKSLTDFEQQFGPALSKLDIKDSNQAYFRSVILVEGKTHYDGIILDLDKDDMIKKIKFSGNTAERTYEIFPLVSVFRDLEIQNVNRTNLYEDDSFEWTWWENFKQKNWITRIIGWIFWLVRFLIVVALVFTAPKIIIQPILQMFIFSPRFSNPTVVIFSFVLTMIAYYAFFVILVLLLDQWLIPMIGSLVFSTYWLAKLFIAINYHRCPECKVMYSALDKGTTFTGRKTTQSSEVYDQYTGTTKTSTTIIRNYKRRKKVTTTHVDSYLDHRMCALCGYQWNVDREVVKEKSKTY